MVALILGPGLKVNARDTASAVVTHMRCDGKPPAPDALLKVLKEGQRQNGGWGKADDEIASDLETSYRVMRCFVMLKARPDNVEGVRSFVAKCRNADGGYAVAPGQPSSIAGTLAGGEASGPATAAPSGAAPAIENARVKVASSKLVQGRNLGLAMFQKE